MWVNYFKHFTMAYSKSTCKIAHITTLVKLINRREIITFRITFSHLVTAFFPIIFFISNTYKNVAAFILSSNNFNVPFDKITSNLNQTYGVLKLLTNVILKLI